MSRTASPPSGPPIGSFSTRGPAADHLALAYFDDWLELLITHELAHVFHLDYGGTMGRIFRPLFGRAQTPLGFPGVLVPGWVIEGLATWYESALTERGPGARNLPRDGPADGDARRAVREHGAGGRQLAAVAGRRPPLRLRLALLRLSARQARPGRHGRVRRGGRAPVRAASAAAVERRRPACLRRIAVERMDRLDERDAGAAEPPRRRARGVRPAQRARGADPERTPWAACNDLAGRRRSDLRPVGWTVVSRGSWPCPPAVRIRPR